MSSARDRLVSGIHSASPAPPSAALKTPDPHPDAEINGAIERTHQRLLADREELIEKVKAYRAQSADDAKNFDVAYAELVAAVEADEASKRTS